MATPKYWIKIEAGQMSIFHGNSPGNIVGSSQGYETRALAVSAKNVLIEKSKQSKNPIVQAPEGKRGMGTPAAGKGKDRISKEARDKINKAKGKKK